MWVAIVAVCLVVAMLVGPIMMLQPSPRQAMLAKLRTAASQLGLAVQLLPDPRDGARDDARYNNRNNKAEKIAAYGLTFFTSASEARPNVSWLIFRQKYEHDVHFLNEWDWQPGSEPCLIGSAWFRQYLSKLPKTIIAVQQSGEHIVLYWTERWEKPKTMDAMLAELNEYLIELKTAVIAVDEKR